MGLRIVRKLNVFRRAALLLAAQRLAAQLLAAQTLWLLMTASIGCAPTVDRDNRWDPSSDAYVDKDGDQYPEVGDCDDDNASINPGVAEVCNSLDDNCDGQSDEGLTHQNFYADEDDDGFGSGPAIERCEALPGEVTVKGDCDDGDDHIFPGAVEVCDGIDQDCDDKVDDGLDEYSWYTDADGDGYGSGLPEFGCELPNDVATVDGDCNDEDAAINPDAREVCNGLDEDCDGDIDDGLSVGTFFVDADGDGYGNPDTQVISCKRSNYVSNGLDCDDTRKDVNPAATEVCDGVDNNCDASHSIDEGFPVRTWYTDSDADGFGTSEVAAQSCSQPNGTANVSGDCDDTAASVYPNATEVCDGLDNDCDGSTDERLETQTYYTDEDGDGFGDANATVTDCRQPEGAVSDDTDCNDGDPEINPDVQERFNGLDDDCDGDIDEHIPVAAKAQGTLSVDGRRPLKNVQVFAGKTDGTSPIVMGSLGGTDSFTGVALWTEYTEGANNPPGFVLDDDVAGAGIAYTPFDAGDDAFMDYAVAVYDSGLGVTTLHLFLGNDVLDSAGSSLTPIELSSNELNGPVTSVQAMDVTGDGVDELLIACSDCSSENNPGEGLVLAVGLRPGTGDEPALVLDQATVIRGSSGSQLGRALSASAEAGFFVASDYEETIWIMSLSSLAEPELTLADVVKSALVADLAPTSPELTSLGSQLLLIPDMTGDGQVELLYSAETQDQAGAVGLVTSVAALSGKTVMEEVSFYFRGIADLQHIGDTLSSVGDVNADGSPDFMIGSVATGASVPPTSASPVELYLVRGGSYRSGTDLQSLTIASFLSSDRNGYGIAAGASQQLDNVGAEDVLFVAPGFAEDSASGLIGVLYSPYSFPSRRTSGAASERSGAGLAGPLHSALFSKSPSGKP